MQQDSFDYSILLGDFRQFNQVGVGITTIFISKVDLPGVSRRQVFPVTVL
jgi:hypothetical protein